MELKADFKKCGYREIITFLQALRRNGVGEATLASRKSAISGWYKWLKRIKVVRENPCDLVESIKRSHKLPQFFTEEEFGKLLAAARTHHDRERNIALLEFVYASGARRAEVANLDVTDIFGGPNAYAKIRMGKGKVDRLVLLSDRFFKAWEAYLPIRKRHTLRWERPTETAAFVNRRTGKRMDGQSIYYTVKKLCKLAGIRALYPHAIRHSTATHMLNHGADLMDIKEQLGHSSLATTQVYLHVALERRREQYRKSHPAAGPEEASGPSCPATS